MRKIRVGVLLAGAVVLTLTVVSIARAQSRSEPNMVFEVAGDNVGRVDVQLLPNGMKEPLRYEFRGEGGSIVGGITLPKEGGATYEITAYDLEGRLTHIGSGSIGNYGQTEKGVQLPLESIDGGGDLVAAVTRERLVLEVDPGGTPQRIGVSGHAFNPRGEGVEIKPGDLTWQLADGRILNLLPKWDDKPGVVVEPKKDYVDFVELCTAEPKVIACKDAASCKSIRVCNGPFVRISAGHEHTCALTSDGVVLCWGTNMQGELGSPTTTVCGNNPLLKCSARPLPVTCPPGAPCRFKAVAAGWSHTVAIDINGDAWWWGRGLPDHHRVNAVLNGVQQKFSIASAGFGHSCAISQSSELWCWGNNAFGEAGVPAATALEVPDSAPVRVLVPFKFKRVAAAGEHTCAVGSGGTDVVCWGRNDSNQVRGTNFTGFPNATTGPFFFQQFGGLVSIFDVTSSPTNTCAVVNFGVKCWGQNALTFAGASAFGVPDKATVGQEHLCGLVGQQASCMGNNVWGQLGTGPVLSQSSPAPVQAPPPLFADLSAGDHHTCGITPDGHAYCWGNNQIGQLGNGNSNIVANRAPVKVVL